MEDGLVTGKAVAEQRVERISRRPEIALRAELRVICHSHVPVLSEARWKLELYVSLAAQIEIDRRRSIASRSRPNNSPVGQLV